MSTVINAEGQGYLYLLHFSGGKVADHAAHYLGWSSNPDDRFQEHISGTGSPLVSAAVDRGLKVEKVKTWEGSRKIERQLKKQKNLARLCPTCRAAHLKKKAERMREYRARNKVTGNADHTPYQIAASNAAGASLQAYTHSNIAQGPLTEEGNIYSQRAITLAGAAEGQSKLDSKSATYRGMLLHEAAARQHRLAMEHHEEQPNFSPEQAENHSIARESHSKASKAHQIAATHAARQLGMGLEHYSAYKGLKQAIRENPTHADNRLILADLLEEHGLEKEANRLRLDPTGHIERAVRAHNRTDMPRYNIYHEDTLIHRGAIGSSIRANRGGTKRLHKLAAEHNGVAGRNMRHMALVAHDLRQRELSDLRERAAAAHFALEQYHQQQADQLP